MGWTRLETRIALAVLRHGTQKKAARSVRKTQGRVSQIVNELVDRCPTLAPLLLPRGRHRTTSADTAEPDCIPLFMRLAA